MPFERLILILCTVLFLVPGDRNTKWIQEDALHVFRHRRTWYSCGALDVHWPATIDIPFYWFLIDAWSCCRISSRMGDGAQSMQLRTASWRDIGSYRAEDAWLDASFFSLACLLLYVQPRGENAAAASFISICLVLTPQYCNPSDWLEPPG